MSDPYPDLDLACFRFTLEALETLRLPRWKGSALRGGFGHVFKRTVCVQPGVERCEACLLRQNCAYAYLFETCPPPDSEVLRTHQAVPQPFVIQPPLEARAAYAPGAQLTFGLTLIGRARDYLPHFLVVFRELGTAGLGQGRGKYALRAVEALHPLTGHAQPVYDGETLLGTGLTLTAREVAAWSERLPPARLALDLLTPARLKSAGRFVQQGPPFVVLLRALLRRLSSLAYFHGGGRWETDYGAWVERAGAVGTLDASTRWTTWARYSGRQSRRIQMGGLTGRVVYGGELAAFRPLLALGQWVHVGKGSVFGNGWYVVGE